MKRALLLTLTLALCGCPRHKLEFGPEGEITDPKQMVALLAKRDHLFNTLQGNAKLKVRAPQGSGTVSQYLAVLRPAALHIETFNFFGKPVSVLVSDGVKFSLYDAEHNTFYTGDATEAAMARFLPISLPPEEIVDLMLGQVPRLPAQSQKLILDSEHQRYVMDLDAPPAKQELFIEPRDLLITQSTITGVNAYNLKLEDYKREEGGLFPHTVTLEAPAADVELTYRYQDITVNGAPDLTLFHQNPPPSATIVSLDAEGRPIQQKQP